MSINPRFLLIMVGSVATAIMFGLLVGHLSVGKPETSKFTEILNAEKADDAVVAIREHNTRFMASIAPGSHIPSILMEVRFAHEAGITQIILESPLPFTHKQLNRLADTIASVKTIAGDITIAIALDCNPPQSWLRENPDDTSTSSTDGLLYPSIGSKKWKADTLSRIGELIAALNTDIETGRIDGFMLQGLEDGNWMRSHGQDQSLIHLDAFRRWVMGRYKNGPTLRAAWNNPALESLESIQLPAETPDDSKQDTFYSPENDRQSIDYTLFLNQTTSKFIGDLASEIRKATNPDFSILAAYPAYLEHAAPKSGAWGIGTFERSEVDGIVTHTMSRHRQAGEHGYFATPLIKGMETLSIDDTYTGIKFNQNTQSIDVPGVFIPNKVFNLMARNATVSALSGTSWVISDASGNGAFAHKPLWKKLDSLLSIRHQILSRSNAGGAKIAVVIDEHATAYVRDAELYESIFESLVDTLIHSGIEFAWTTLDAMVQGKAPNAPVYLFPNLFKASAETRNQLHAILSEQHATALWLYAPGYIDEIASVENISSLTGITTVMRDPSARTGSKFVFSGTWIQEKQDYGITREIAPTFTSKDEYADPLARYRDDGSISIAMKYLDGEWTSVVIYEPTLSPDLIRDLFYILEIPMDVALISPESNPAVLVNSGTILLYSDQDAVANLEFQDNHDVSNLLNAQQGWNDSQTISINLKAGEAALLSLR